jgi:site-specific DNA recombinase
VTITIEGAVTDDIGLLEWLMQQADQNVPEAFKAAAIPVAWLGRTSTDDAQDPTLSLPRQLDNSRLALPAGFVIVAHFYDVESGRTALEHRGRGHAHAPLAIPIPRDGGIADLLEEAKRPDRRFVAVVCESIERVARKTYFSTKIEHELEKAGVALLAADEGIDPSTLNSSDRGEAPYRRATPTLMRRIKQAIAEWYVLNMLELTWGGLKQHTAQGFNIGKPPYGYLAQPVKHPNKARAREGKTKHRLTVDSVRGPVVTQIFVWRGIERLSREAIANRLNLDLERNPPPDPILGDGPRRRVGRWTSASVREVLDNPKHTGYMVWNRRKRGHPNREVKGRANPPSAWVWSARPTHEANVTKALFEAATSVGRFRQGSAPASTTRPKASTRRTYALRSYVICDICEHRFYGEVQKGLTYYRCTPDSEHNRHKPWFAEHPRAVYVREDLLLDPLARFLRDRVFGRGRGALINAADLDGQDRRARLEREQALNAAVAELQRQLDNLIHELAQFTTTGDTDADSALKAGLREEFATVRSQQRTKKEELEDLLTAVRGTEPATIDVLDQLPHIAARLDKLPDDRARRLYDAMQLEVRYNCHQHEVTLRVTVAPDTMPELLASLQDILQGTDDDPVRDALHAPPARAKVRDVLRDPGGAPVLSRPYSRRSLLT